MKYTEYVDDLKIAMEQKGYDILYIEKCCLYAENLLKKNLPVIFDEEHLRRILKLDEINLNAYSFYTIYHNSKKRKIMAPSKKIKVRQRWILDNILSTFVLPNYIHGFTPSRSIVTNAKQHLNKNCIISIDIQDFFPSIKVDKIREIFIECGYTKKVANMLTSICTFNGELPQGAPTSPCLANIAFRNVDKALILAIENKDIVYTRYADDLTFSSISDIEKYLQDIILTIESLGYKVNNDKTHIMKVPYRKLVTGLVVTDNIKVPKGFKRRFNQELYYCEKFGVSSHLKNGKMGRSVNFREYMYGKAYFIKMVEPNLGEDYLNRLDKLSW